MTLRSLTVTLAISVAGLGLPVVARGEDNYLDRNAELTEVYRRLELLESQQHVYPHQVYAPVQSQPDYATLETEGRPSWIFRADLLYWSVRNPSTEYAITDIGGVQDRGAVGSVLTIDSEYDSGYRLSFGRRVGCCSTGPEFLFTYTDFNQTIGETFAGSVRSTFISSDNSENDDSDNINTLGVETITPDDRATSVDASYSFSYEVYDFEIGQTLVATDYFSWRVGGVGRVMDVEQEFSVAYSGGDFQTRFSPFETSDYEGGGILLDTDLSWYVFGGLTIDVGAKAGAMLGTFKTQTFIPDDEPGVPTDVTYRDKRMSTVLEMNAGVTYRHQFGRFLLTGSAGYEMTQLFDFYDHRVFSDSHQEGQNVRQLGTLSLDGLYARAGVEF